MLVDYSTEQLCLTRHDAPLGTWGHGKATARLFVPFLRQVTLQSKPYRTLLALARMSHAFIRTFVAAGCRLCFHQLLVRRPPGGLRHTCAASNGVD